MILNFNDGVIARDPAQAQQLEAAGYHRCYGKRAYKGQPCDFFLSPQTVEHVKDQGGGYYSCPRCGQSFDLLEHLPWHGVSQDEWDPSSFASGGGTRIGLPMQDQSQIGEDLIAHIGELPDGTTEEWGLEVKTLGYDTTHHRFIPGGVRGGFDEKAAKNEMAQQLGLKGVLGILVLLDYRRSVADIYAKEMPLEGWLNGQGKMQQGVAAFRSNTAQHLIAEVPFKNPLMNPADPSPISHTPVEEPMPF
jgi:hypothetical protein